MKIALTVWEKEISPVFDSSSTLLIVNLKDNQIKNRRLESFNPDQPMLLIEHLKNMHVSLLICGAISKFPFKLIEFSQVTIISFISGKVDDVLTAMKKDLSIVPRFLLPGCKNVYCGKTQYKSCRKKTL